MNKHSKKASIKDIENPERYCSDHKKVFSITQGCDECRKAGWCPYYGRECCCG